MKIKQFNWFLKLIMPKNFYGITLFPFGIYFKDISRVTEKDKRHEIIHWYQQREMVGIFFYIWYFTEWFIKVVFPPKGAYRDISFEREAYRHENEADYKHQPYAWIKYIYIKL